MKTLRILQINSVCGVGSTGKIAVDIANVLKANGHDCLVCYGRGIAKGNVDSYKIGNSLSNKIHGIKTRLTDKHGLGSKKCTKKLIKKIIEYSPDVVQLHNLHGYYINYELLFEFLKQYNKPVVWTLHDCWAFTGHCSCFDYACCTKWQNLCEKCPQKKEYPVSLLVDNSKSNFRRKQKSFTKIEKMIIITPSNWLNNLVGQSFLGKYETKTINNGIDLNVFKLIENDFRKNNKMEDVKIILGVADIWSEKKGFKDFILLSKMLGENEKIVLVGLDNRQMLDLPINVIGIKRTENQTELAKIYYAADVFVNPTYEDNFPTTNLEALACGTPVITYHTGGSVESISPNCGAIVEKGDINELYSKIKAINKSEKSIKLCIEKSELYDKNERFLDYIKVYESLYQN